MTVIFIAEFHFLEKCCDWIVKEYSGKKGSRGRIVVISWAKLIINSQKCYLQHYQERVCPCVMSVLHVLLEGCNLLLLNGTCNELKTLKNA